MESVMGQTFSDYELIIVDNGSNDGSSEIVAGFTDPRIRIIRLEENVGVSNARNKGVDLSTAPYITFIDADDWWEPTFLEEMAGLMERHPGAGIYGTSYYIVKNGKKRLAPIGVEEGFDEGEINYCRVYAKTLCMPLTSISVCIPRKVFDEVGGFPTSIKLGEDFMLWLSVALKHKVVFLNKNLSNYNQDVDVTYRGTHHLHPPKYNMLWRLGEYEPLEKTNPDYKQLIDNLRTYSLMNYLLVKQYRDAARKELAKVDWRLQPTDTRRLYQKPIPYLKLRMQFFTLGSKVKQFLIKHV
jgi:glycosyltransferase involved in cell wall biosynthesis